MGPRSPGTGLAWSAGEAAEGYRHSGRRAVAGQPCLDPVAGLACGQHRLQRGEGVGRLPGQGRDDAAGRDPGPAAALPGETATTPTPAGWPLASATVCAAMPSEARPELPTLPVAISWAAMLVTVSLGIANPIPAAVPPICGSAAS